MDHSAHALFDWTIVKDDCASFRESLKLVLPFRLKIVDRTTNEALDCGTIETLLIDATPYNEGWDARGSAYSFLSSSGSACCGMKPYNKYN